ncbi:MAG: DUF2203 family protein [Planctomycetales bacterium]|nr:DUF2203 family protein [Planctomycetales bacterium]NIM09666.1 DUF2203 family protein [Planctomycetales bacterium]NIN09149.1 DUF2203 family protein [Planctomycetales bacterium]NIN78256.1 DUF2203 family protein [Planctomycetales bacterium]NIO35447.1 DUF2203 family protein [Planctomycetales bacterium]
MEASDFKRLFTVDEANAMLPLVRAICRDLSNLAREVIDRRQRLSFLQSRREKDRDDLYGEELAQIEEELEKDSERLEEYVHELKELGVEPKNAVEGLVDFPCAMEDRIIYLCWKLDEPEVLHWHELDAGFAGRQPLTAGSSAVEENFGSDSGGLG